MGVGGKTLKFKGGGGTGEVREQLEALSCISLLHRGVSCMPSWEELFTHKAPKAPPILTHSHSLVAWCVINGPESAGGGFGEKS
jgi:hypothetical protein